MATKSPLAARELRAMYQLHLDDADRPPEMQGVRGAVKRVQAKIALKA